MASFRAIEAISDVLIRLLRTSHELLVSESAGPEDVHESLQFDLYQTDDFQSSGSSDGSTDVSLYLYRVAVDGTNRTPSGRRTASGRTQPSQLPLELRYLLTIWTQDAKKQHRIAGWLMRTLETVPVIPSGVLHGEAPAIFEPDETLQVIANDLNDEKLFRIWDGLEEPYRLSIPYLVRTVQIESGALITDGPPVERRIFDFLQHDRASEAPGLG